jgi:CRP-like cAMP-binding protein
MQRTEIGRIQDPALVERVTALLGARATFAGIEPAQIGELARRGAHVELATGETLIREGEGGAGEIYLLLEGSLVVQSRGVFIARLDQTGDLIGEAAVLLSAQRNADVVAEKTTTLLAIPAGLIALPEFAEIAASFRAGMLRDDWVQY